MKKSKPLGVRKCKQCNIEFKKTNPLQSVCSVLCALNRSYDLNKKKREKESKDKTNEMKKGLLTHKDYLKMLQTVFNTFIRLRDKNDNCISCDAPMKGRKGDASHYYPTTYQYLRFNEDNAHLACVTCNQFKHGNLIEYLPRLTKKIGEFRVQVLHNNRHKKLELSIPEIQDLIKHYKLKIKSLH